MTDPDLMEWLEGELDLLWQEAKERGVEPEDFAQACIEKGWGVLLSYIGGLESAIEDVGSVEWE